jgi:hypothetical protein
MPDLSAAIGWDTRSGIRAGVATNWWVSGGGPVMDFHDARYLVNAVKPRVRATVAWSSPVTGRYNRLESRRPV